MNGQHFYSWHVHSYPSGIHVNVGDEVVASQRIADVGDNGMATGPQGKGAGGWPGSASPAPLP